MSEQRAFTLLELVVAMTIVSLVSVALYGVVSIGARSAAAGERATEQSRRLRIATNVMVRQLRSTAPLYAMDEEDEEALPYFLGESDRIDFVTALPQAPQSTGLAIVSYWLEEGALMMSETPYFLAFAGDVLARNSDDFTLETPLLYDVQRVQFSYQRSNFGEDTWEDEWDASYEDSLPAAVRIEVLPDGVGGTTWYHEVPVFVGVMNEITGESDFRRRSSRAPRLGRQEEEEDEEQELEEEEDEDFEDEEDDDE